VCIGYFKCNYKNVQGAYQLFYRLSLGSELHKGSSCMKQIVEEWIWEGATCLRAYKKRGTSVFWTNTLSWVLDGRDYSTKMVLLVLLCLNKSRIRTFIIKQKLMLGNKGEFVGCDILPSMI
jgi:hypothetical protein